MHIHLNHLTSFYNKPFFLQIWARLTSKSDGAVSGVDGLGGLNVEADAGQAYLYSELYKTKKRYDTTSILTETSLLFSFGSWSFEK